jgi:hypothetical protein
MAPRKSKSPGKSAKYYGANPKARKKKGVTDKKVNARPAQKAKRAELAAERRKRGMMGKGGKDLSHTKSGGMVRESPKKNRGRQGANGKSTKK